MHSESSSKGKANFSKFSLEFTRHGAMSSMHEHLKHKHPVEMEADQQEQEYGGKCEVRCALSSVTVLCTMSMKILI